MGQLCRETVCLCVGLCYRRRIFAIWGSMPDQQGARSAVWDKTARIGHNQAAPSGQGQNRANA
ncbi:hypothetical protein MACH17_16560 [Phaeobacter inhibens]|nr:hypothetical protein MACH17_16560 [Phaeobacter inhibens]